jgi:hypothetical protein
MATAPKVAAPKAAKPKAKKIKEPKVVKVAQPITNNSFVGESKLGGEILTWPPKIEQPITPESFDGAENSKIIMDEFSTWQSPSSKIFFKVDEVGGCVEFLSKHLRDNPDYQESVRHALDGLLFTEAKKRMVRRNKANISVADLEEIVKDMMPKLMDVFKID